MKLHGTTGSAGIFCKFAVLQHQCPPLLLIRPTVMGFVFRECGSGHGHGCRHGTDCPPCRAFVSCRKAIFCAVGSEKGIFDIQRSHINFQTAAHSIVAIEIFCVIIFECGSGNIHSGGSTGNGTVIFCGSADHAAAGIQSAVHLDITDEGTGRNDHAAPGDERIIMPESTEDDAGGTAAVIHIHHAAFINGNVRSFCAASHIHGIRSRTRLQGRSRDR